jgi:hypothetical protein
MPSKKRTKRVSKRVNGRTKKRSADTRVRAKMRAKKGNHKAEILFGCVGAAIGTVSGGITALLFTPVKGKKMREIISNQYYKAEANTNGAIDHIMGKAEVLARKGKRFLRM